MVDLAGKRIVVCGALTSMSIALSAARILQRAGADLVLTGFGPERNIAERTAASLPSTPMLLECDSDSSTESVAHIVETLRRHWGGMDGFVHSVALDPRAASGWRQRTDETDLQDLAIAASERSSSSLSRWATAIQALMGEAGGSIVALDFDATAAWPESRSLDPSESPLRVRTRELANRLGPLGIRVNLVAPGPLAMTSENTPTRREPTALLGWDPSHPLPVAQVVCFLLSDWSRAITSQCLFVDGGLHARAPSAASRVA